MDEARSFSRASTFTMMPLGKLWPSSEQPGHALILCTLRCYSPADKERLLAMVEMKGEEYYARNTRSRLQLLDVTWTSFDALLHNIAEYLVIHDEVVGTAIGAFLAAEVRSGNEEALQDDESRPVDRAPRRVSGDRLPTRAQRAGRAGSRCSRPVRRVWPAPSRIRTGGG